MRTFLRNLTSATVLSLFAVPCLAQPQPSIKQQATTASCSNVVVTGGVATFTCGGLTPDQIKILKDIPALLTKILKQTQDISELKALVNTEVGFHYTFLSKSIGTNGRKELTISEQAMPENNVAKELHFVQQTAMLRNPNFYNPTNSEEADKHAWNQFAETVRNNRSKAVGSDVSVGGAHEANTRMIQLSRQDIDDMKHFRLRIYILSAAWWKNVSGSRDAAAACVFLGSDVSPDDDPYNLIDPPIHLCASSKDDF